MHRTSGRPGLLVAAGALLLIVGGWTVLGVLCAGGAIVFQNAVNPLVGGGDEFNFGVDPEVAHEVPSAPFVEAGGAFLNLLLGVLMLVAGMGVLQVRPTARLLAIAVGVADLALTLLHSLYNALLVFPVQERIFKEEAQNFGGGPFNIFEALHAGMWGGLIFQVIFSVLWWGVVIYFLLHPSVHAAFDGNGDGEPAPEPYPGRRFPRRDDFDDD